MALINISAAAPRAGWRSWYLVLDGGIPHLMGFGDHTIPRPFVPGQAPPPQPGQAGLLPHEAAYGGFIWHPGTNEVVAPGTGHPFDSAFYAETSSVNAQRAGRLVGAYGRVESWGTTWDLGSRWESQFARVLEIFVAPFHSGRVAAVAGHYGVPVSIG